MLYGTPNAKLSYRDDLESTALTRDRILRPQTNPPPRIAMNPLNALPSQRRLSKLRRRHTTLRDHL
jgi:hypothetical protein